MPESLASLLQTPLFKFTVGPDGNTKDFEAHIGVIGAQSDQLKGLMRPGFQEGNDKQCRLEHVDVDTFSRFLEFAYTGSYTDPMPEKRGSSMRLTRPSAEASDSFLVAVSTLVDGESVRHGPISISWNDSSQAYVYFSRSYIETIGIDTISVIALGGCHVRMIHERSVGVKSVHLVFPSLYDFQLFQIHLTIKSKITPLWKKQKVLACALQGNHEQILVDEALQTTMSTRTTMANHARNHSTEAPVQTSFADKDFHVNVCPVIFPACLWAPPVLHISHDFGAYILPHARLYIFSNERMAECLRQTVLCRIHAILQKHQLAHEDVQGLVNLIDLVFDEDSLPDQDPQGNPEPLKDLLVSYVNMYQRVVEMEQPFVNLMSGGGPFAATYSPVLQQTEGEGNNFPAMMRNARPLFGSVYSRLTSNVKDTGFSAWPYYQRASFEVHGINSYMKSLFETLMFTFTVGKEGEEIKDFVVHTGVISAQSDQLKALMTAEFKEAQEKKARLDNVDISTFRRFVEFAYSRSYTDAEPKEWDREGEVKLLKEWDGEGEVKLPENSNRQSQTVKRNHRRKHLSASGEHGEYLKCESKYGMDYGTSEDTMEIRKAQAVSAIASTIYDTEQFPHTYPALPWPRPSLDEPRKFEPVFLAHAKLYIFGEYCIAPRIKQTALHRIHEILKDYDADSTNLVTILAFISLVFEEGNLPDEEDEPLKLLVTTYIVTQMDNIGASKILSRSLSEGGPFVSLFWSIHQLKILA